MIAQAPNTECLSDTLGMVFVTEWLAQQFLNPMDADRVDAARSLQGQVALRWMGDFLDQPDVADTICRTLTKDGVNDVVTSLQRRYTVLFCGIFRECCVLPYASAWDGTGHLFGPAVDRMHAILTDLDVHVPARCSEPADHLAIQLACMAEALRQKNEAGVRNLLDEMQPWAGRFSNALFKADSAGFYGNAAQFLIALLDQISLHHSREVHQDTAATAVLT